MKKSDRKKKVCFQRIDTSQFQPPIKEQFIFIPLKESPCPLVQIAREQFLFILSEPNYLSAQLKRILMLHR